MKTSMIADMHYAALAGAGWTSAETPGGPVLTATSPAAGAEGSFDIPVDSIAGFYPNMLLTYLAADGQHYPFRLNSVIGSGLRADRKIKAIAAGGTIHNVYLNDAHPNVKGGALIVDSLLRQLAGPQVEIERILREALAWSAYGAATVSDTPQSLYTYPGSDSAGERALTVSGTNIGDGVISAAYAVQGGDYVIRFPFCTGNRSTIYNNAITIYVDELRADGSTVQIVEQGPVIGYDALDVAEIPVSVPYGSSIRMRVVCPNSGPWVFSVGQIDFRRVRGPAVPLNAGKHVLFGDSWLTPGSPIATAMAARLPGATVIAKGVGGNRASQMIARFSADVTPEAPNFVWLVVGTNDYYASVTPAAFEDQIALLKQMVVGIGATPIVITPSVGALTYTPPQMIPSRRYVTYVRFGDFVDAIPNVSAAPWRSTMVFDSDVNIPAGQSSVLFVSAVKTKSAAFLHTLTTSQPGVVAQISYSSNADGSSAVDVNEFDCPLVNRWAKRQGDSTPRFVVISLRNTTSAQVGLTAVADLSIRNEPY